MTDIVERLRSANGQMGVRDPNDYGITITVAEANQAANEIERLRAALLSIANNTGCVEACPCWAKQRHKAERALLTEGER